MSDEKKDREKRSLIEKDVVINGVVMAQALDISVEGMYIYTQASFIPGAIFEVSFRLGDDIIKAMARVQHAQPGIGIGVQFVELAAADLEKIRRYIGE